ncbi:hypothetical protein P691DRAFT_802979 [Macrolepiota fuliginosa MF-IS2]|uniref:Uncharacterized protein n=1 Tax=Macrolepiota fuliginosa MF-IS2 TaxID=1400762 RepID=A0A9P6C394_9AGAR|nr:hypothetical protein P691DRAFT_802979 [Macrolepiota fuliginosa MF-IS2]
MYGVHSSSKTRPMSTFAAFPILTPNLIAGEHSHSWNPPPTLTLTLTDADPFSALHLSEPASGSSVGDNTNGSIPGPRGHHLPWAISPRLTQAPGTPAFPQISLSLSPLSCCSQPKTGISTLSSSLLTSAPSSPPLNLKSGVRSKSISSFLLRAPAPRPVSICKPGHNNAYPKGSSGNRTRANTIASTPPPTRRSAFATTAAFFTSMSRPSRDTIPTLSHSHSHASLRHAHTHAHGHATSSAASASPGTSAVPIPISNTSRISSEDARLLDPSYLSSMPMPSYNGYHGYSSSGIGSGRAYIHAIPYIDPQGTLHDPDYRPFPLIRQSKQPIPSPFAPRKPYWESDDDEFEFEFGDRCGDVEDDGVGSTPSTPTFTTPFICYFLETHQLKRGSSPRRAGSSSRVFGRNGNGRKREKEPNSVTGTRSHLKVSTTFMGAAGIGPTTPTLSSVAVPMCTTVLSTSPPAMGGVSSMKDKKGWSGILWRSGKKEGEEKE